MSTFKCNSKCNVYKPIFQPFCCFALKKKHIFFDYCKLLQKQTIECLQKKTTTQSKMKMIEIESNFHHELQTLQSKDVFIYGNEYPYMKTLYEIHTRSPRGYKN